MQRRVGQVDSSVAAASPEQARRALGRQIVAAREARKWTASRLAGAAGTSVAHLRNAEKGRVALPLLLIVRIAQALDVERDIAGSWFWLGFAGAGAGPETRAYLSSLFPLLASRECDGLSGPALSLRTQELSELADLCGRLTDKLELLLAERSAQSATMQADAQREQTHLIPLDDLVDAFPGESAEQRRSAAVHWWRQLGDFSRARHGNELVVWAWAPLPDGRAAKVAVRSARGGRGRRSAPVDPRAWQRFIELQVGPTRASTARAWRIMQLEGRRHKWLWKLSPRTARERMHLFFKDFPHLKRGAVE